jgi:exonuclease VII large subunit
MFRMLAEGFALVRDAAGHAVTSAAAARAARDMTLTFADGMVPALARADEEDS